MPSWHDIRHNAYTENPGSDWIALDGVLTPIGRASTEEAIRRASPDAAHYMRRPAMTETTLPPAENVVTKALTGLAATADPVPAIDPFDVFFEGIDVPADEPVIDAPAPAKPHNRSRKAK